ncbi:GTP cyclohydrolase I [Rhodococcoides fascians]|uniref:GTP cyclohydrolase I n=1 Tax=Rhodococcoides fascians TaxID=1828 RepID=UPI000AB59436|nr:GTP cyclohydrolase I [Rhodococcus fascians]
MTAPAGYLITDPQPKLRGPISYEEAARVMDQADAEAELERAALAARDAVAAQDAQAEYTSNLQAAAAAVGDLLAAFNIDEGDHTADTPNRVAKAWTTMLKGYGEDPSIHLEKTFSAPNEPGPVIVSGIRLISTCAHHLLPFTGYATVAYRAAPGQNVVGLSKLARLVDGYARRLQVQERIGDQIVSALVDKLNPMWACVIITASHQCMTIRGVQEANAETTTRSVRGALIGDDLAVVTAAHRDSLRKG